MADLRIPYPIERAQQRSLSIQQWGVLVNTSFPGAMHEDSILAAWDLAQVRGVDPFSGHIAIVTQRRKVDNSWVDQESCWLTLKAQIYLAHKTGAFAGIDPVQFGPVSTRTYEGYDNRRNEANRSSAVTLEVPEYVVATVYRFVQGQRCAFSDTVFFDDVVPMAGSLPTPMWRKAPGLMLAKCAKAAALRLGFAECDYSADEMTEQVASAAQAQDLVPDADPMSSGNPHGAASHSEADGPVTNLHTGPQVGASVEHFDQLAGKTLARLARDLDAAMELGAFDEALDNLRAALPPEEHTLSTGLIQAARTMLQDRRGEPLWKYIQQARRHGPTAYAPATAEVRKQADAGQLSGKAARAAVHVLSFFKALAEKGDGRSAA